MSFEQFDKNDEIVGLTYIIGWIREGVNFIEKGKGVNFIERGQSDGKINAEA